MTIEPHDPIRTRKPARSRLLNGALLGAAMTAMMALPGTGQAQSIPFEGTRENVNPLSPPGTGRCVPPHFNTVTIAPGALSSTGTSNLGTFTSTQSHCIASPPPTSIFDGLFTYTFRGGDTITGTYTGNVGASATPGVFDSTENLVITGGTGRFTGASGTITSSGTLRFLDGAGVFNGIVSGSLTATATVSSGAFATALGVPSAATGDYATALGTFSYASGANATAVGSFAEAVAEGAVAVGDGAYAAGPAAMALGQDAAATATAATAVGANASASGERSLAAGNAAAASGAGSVAIGDATVSSGLNATAMGQGAQATAVASAAVGHNSRATALAASAFGVSAQATGLGATAVGRLANASADGATAVGAGSSATFAGSTAVGSGAATTAANQVALGGAGSSVRIGDIAASTAAQSGPVAVMTVDASGTVGRSTTLIPNLAALQTAQGMLAAQIDELFDLRNLDRRDMRQGIAAAVAMGHAPMPSAPGRTAYVLNGSTFRGEMAVGGSILHRFRGETPFAIGAGFSFAGNRNNAFRVGVAGEF